MNNIIVTSPSENRRPTRWVSTALAGGLLVLLSIPAGAESASPPPPGPYSTMTGQPAVSSGFRPDESLDNSRPVPQEQQPSYPTQQRSETAAGGSENIPPAASYPPPFPGQQRRSGSPTRDEFLSRQAERRRAMNQYHQERMNRRQANLEPVMPGVIPPDPATQAADFPSLEEMQHRWDQEKAQMDQQWAQEKARQDQLWEQRKTERDKRWEDRRRAQEQRWAQMQKQHQQFWNSANPSGKNSAPVQTRPEQNPAAAASNPATTRSPEYGYAPPPAYGYRYPPPRPGYYNGPGRGYAPAYPAPAEYGNRGAPK